MSVTYLMSYPGPDWHIRGGENLRSQSRPPTSPRLALREWIAVADTILRAGGHILVMPPPSVEPSLTGLVYTINAGQAFLTQEKPVFLLASMAAPHRVPERDFVRALAAEAGLVTRVAQQPWEGQADLQTVVGSNRWLATWGIRSSRASVDEVRQLLPSNARLLDLQLQPPFTHGSLALAPLVNPGGDVVLLAHGGAFVGVHVEAIRRFVGASVEVLPVDREDALAFACHALAVNGTLLVPVGVSAALRGQLVRRGFLLEELDLPELCGKGGGGPRALVNELRGLVLGEGAPDYASRREEVVAKLDEYPETVTKGAT